MRLYGNSIGYSSFAVVTKGFKGSLEKAKSLSGFMPTDAYDEYVSYPGAEDKCALLCGFPYALNWLSRRGSHEYKAFMVAPNSSWVPPSILTSALDNCTELLTPSRWGKEVLDSNFEDGNRIPVRVVPHGLSDGFGNAEAPKGPFTILHMASTGLDRKSTLKLVEAFMGWHKRGDARLLLVLEQVSKNIVSSMIAEANGWKMPDDIAILSRVNASPDVMRMLFSSCHVVCQPSRAEGFGLVPLEAMACGVPAVLTKCTGHTEYLIGPTLASAVIVEHGPDDVTDDGPPSSGSVSPTVEVEAIRAALDRAFDSFSSVKQAALAVAPAIRDIWSWDRQLSPWIEYTKTI